MGSVLSSLPGIGGLLNRWVASGTDAGVMFVDHTFVKLGDYEIKLPVAISLSARREVRIQKPEQLPDTIKFMGPCVDTHITLAGFAGNWRKTTLPSLPTIPGVGGMVGGASGLLAMALGTDEHIDKIDMLKAIFGQLKKADGPIDIIDAEGFLSGQGIHYAVPISLDESQLDEQVAWTMTLAADTGETALELIFPQEGKVQAE